VTPAPSENREMLRTTFRSQGRGEASGAGRRARRWRRVRAAACYTSPKLGCCVPRNFLFASPTLLWERSRLRRGWGGASRERRPAATRQVGAGSAITSQKPVPSQCRLFP